jgi:hypothetical protein
VISGERKTAPASESLAHNLAANATNGEKTVHGDHHGPPRGMPSRSPKADFRHESALPGMVNHC